jgi:hypothetical protein
MVKTCEISCQHITRSFRIMFIKVELSWGWAPCRFVGRCQRFWGTYFLHLKSWSDKISSLFLSLRSSNPIGLWALHYPALSIQPWRWRQHISPKGCHRPTRPHGVQTQGNTNTIGRLVIIGWVWRLRTAASIALFTPVWSWCRPWYDGINWG